MGKKPMSLAALPDTCLASIVGYLEVLDRLRLAQMCHGLRKLVEEAPLPNKMAEQARSLSRLVMTDSHDHASAQGLAELQRLFNYGCKTQSMGEAVRNWRVTPQQLHGLRNGYTFRDFPSAFQESLLAYHRPIPIVPACDLEDLENLPLGSFTKRLSVGGLHPLTAVRHPRDDSLFLVARCFETGRITGRGVFDRPVRMPEALLSVITIGNEPRRLRARVGTVCRTEFPFLEEEGSKNARYAIARARDLREHINLQASYRDSVPPESMVTVANDSYGQILRALIRFGTATLEVQGGEGRIEWHCRLV